MGGSSGSSGTSEVRYAPYIEARHEAFLGQSQTVYGDSLRPPENSPFVDYEDLDFDDAFFGSGSTISSFPAIFDLFGTYGSSVVLNNVFEESLSNVQNTTTIQNAVIAHRDLLNDDIEQVTIPRFEEGMRDINAVMASTFIVGKSIIEQGRLKKVAEFDADLRYKLIPVAAEIFSKKLAWNQGLISTYIEIMKFHVLTKLDTDGRNYEFAAKNTMWPFTVLEQERANLAALQGAYASSSSEAGVSKTAKVLGGAISGAALGAQVGGGYGAIIGGIAGGIAGLF